MPPADLPNLLDRHNRIMAAILTRFRNMVLAATEPLPAAAAIPQASLNAMTMNNEVSALVCTFPLTPLLKVLASIIISSPLLLYLLSIHFRLPNPLFPLALNTRDSCPIPSRCNPPLPCSLLTSANAMRTTNKPPGTDQRGPEFASSKPRDQEAMDSRPAAQARRRRREEP